MKRMSRIVLLALASAGVSACSSPPELAPRTIAAADITAPVTEQCVVATSIEVVHLVNSALVTDRLRLSDDAASDATLSLLAFQVAADSYGAANIVSSRPINQIECSPQAAAAAARLTPHLDPSGSSLCVDWNGVLDCTPVDPTHTYSDPSTSSCTVTNYNQAVTLSCADSNAIVTRAGDVVLTINTQALRDDIAARTQALRRLVGDANVLTNIHFDVVITPDQQASIVGNDAYNNIAQQIKNASDHGQPLPDVKAILAQLPQPPTNIDFYNQLVKAYQTKLDRLNLMAQITSGNLLSPQQVNAFYQKFIANSQLIEQLDVSHSTSSLNQAASLLNDTISELASTDPSSTIYNQVKAGAQSMLQAHTTSGVFDPDHTIDFVVPNLYQSLTDPDLEKQLVASEMLIELNQAMQNGGAAKAAAMAGPLGLLVDALSNDDMERVFRLYDQVQATEFFFDNIDPTGTSYDVQLTPTAQAMFNIQAAPNSASSYEVINLLNESADYNAQTGKVTVDYTAVISLNARQALTANDLERAMYHTEEAYGVLGFLKNVGLPFLGGSLKELGSTVKGVWYTSAELWSDPGAFADHLKSALANWQQTFWLVAQQGIDIIRQWPGMTTEQRAELVGRIATQVLLSLPAEAKEASQINAALQEAVKVDLEYASRGLQIVERGGVALSEEAAAELAKRLEAFGITATDEAVEVADGLDDLLPCNLVTGVVPHVFTPAGVKPPCDVTQLEAAFEGVAKAAQDMGFKAAEDLRDLIKSKEVVAAPGLLLPNAMPPKEIDFANRIIDERGGVFIGNEVESRAAIDGFYRGFPAQLKSLTSTNATKIVDRLVQTQKVADAISLKGIHVYIDAPNMTTADVLERINATDAITGITRAGTVISVEIFVEGHWIRVANGVLQP